MLTVKPVREHRLAPTASRETFCMTHGAPKFTLPSGNLAVGFRKA
jgi:hypothetical protein